MSETKRSKGFLDGLKKTWESLHQLLGSDTRTATRRDRRLAPLQELEDRRLLSVTPVGTEFRVNTTTQNSQQTSPQTPQAVAINPTTGDYVVVWSSKHQFGSDTWDVFMQRYNAAGVAQGSETLVTPHVDGDNHQYASVAMNSSGNFVVTWSSDQNGHWDVYAQRFNASGVAQGSAILVDTPTNKDQEYSTVAIDDAGNFVVTWSGQQSGKWQIYANSFDQNGISQGGPFRVSNSSDDEMFAEVAMNGAGAYVITWSGKQSGNWDVYAQLYGPNNQPVASIFQVNTATNNDQQYSTAAIDAAGNFTVTWSGHQSGKWAIYGQTYQANGAAISAEFQVSPSIDKDQQYSSVTYGSTSNPIIAWSSKDLDGNGWGVFAQQVDTSGNLVGALRQVNTYTHDHQEYVSLAGDQNGNLVAVWTSDKQDSDNEGVYGQRFMTGVSSANISVTPSSVQTSEAGTTATFGVALTSAPTSNVTINLSTTDSAQGTLSTSTLTFTSSNWNVAQTVTVTGLDDHIVLGDQTYQINGTASSSDTNYNGLAMPAVTVVNTEADVAGFTITPTTLTTSETGTSASFTVALTSQPLAPVTINLTNGNPAQGTLSQSSLTFDATNWNTAQTVTVTGVNDHIVHGNQTYQITGTASSSDTVYNGLTMTPVNVTNTEANVAGFTVTPTSIQTSMSGASASFSVVMTSQPTAPVTINLSSSNPSEGTLSTSTLTFDAGNWNVAQIVTVTGQIDLLAGGDVTYQITGTAVSSDSNYNGLGMTPVTVTNVNTALPGFIVTPTTLTTSETGTSATFSIALATLPLTPVTVTLTNGNPTEGTLSQSSLTFTLLNWSTPQSVTVTGLDDQIVSGDQSYQITGIASGLLSNYDGLAITPITVTNTESDVASIHVTAASLTTSESGTSASFGVTLTSQPTSPVTINLATSVVGQGSLSQSTLTFDATNWNVAQNVTVTGLDDQIVHGDQTYQVTGTATSTDANYNNLAMTPVTVTNTEADIAGFTVTPTSLTTSESGTSASFTVALTSQPIAPVTVNLQPTDPSQGSLSQWTLTFDASNWNVAQTVNVTGLNSYMTTPSVTYQITGSATSADAVYHGLDTTPVAVTNTVTPNASSTTVVASANPSVYGQFVTFTATVSGVAPMTGTPTGTVIFFDGATNLATVTLSAGSATYTTSTFSAGVHNITVTYAGDAYFSANTSNVLAETITPATLTVTAADASRIYGQANPAFSATITGFVNGDTASVVSGNASLTTMATAGSAAGSYPITSAQGSLSAANYTFAFANGTLTITPIATPPVPPAQTPTPPPPPTSIPPVSLIPLTPSSNPFGSNPAGTSPASAATSAAPPGLLSPALFLAATAPNGRGNDVGTDASLAVLAGINSATRTIQVFSPIPQVTWREGQMASTVVATESSLASLLPRVSLGSTPSAQVRTGQADDGFDVLNDEGERVPWTEAGLETTMVIGTGVMAASGYVLLNSRLGLWLLGLLTSQPLWKQFDPLEVLYAWEEEDRVKDDQDEETLLSLVDQ